MMVCIVPLHKIGGRGLQGQKLGWRKALTVLQNSR